MSEDTKLEKRKSSGSAYQNCDHDWIPSQWEEEPACIGVDGVHIPKTNTLTKLICTKCLVSRVL
jgi:hypothetical protein